MPTRRVLTSLLLVLAVWSVDRWTKLWAVSALSPDRSIDILGSWFALTLHRNTGAAFGIGAHAPAALTVFAAGLTVFLAVWWLRTLTHKGSGWDAAALALIVGGSAGNLTDRFAEGAVIDFIDFKVWPIFNAADIAITAGAVLWALRVLLTSRKGAR